MTDLEQNLLRRLETWEKPLISFSRKTSYLNRNMKIWNWQKYWL